MFRPPYTYIDGKGWFFLLCESRSLAKCRIISLPLSMAFLKFFTHVVSSLYVCLICSVGSTFFFFSFLLIRVLLPSRTWRMSFWNVFRSLDIYFSESREPVCRWVRFRHDKQNEMRRVEKKKRENKMTAIKLLWQSIELSMDLTMKSSHHASSRFQHIISNR